MDGGAWWATVHGVARVEQALAIEPPPPGVRDSLLRFDCFRFVAFSKFPGI